MINWTFRMPGVEPTGRRLASWGHPKWRKKPCCEKNRGSRGLVRWKMAIDYLVGGDWNHGILWLSHHIGNFIIPTDFNSMIFQMGSYTTKQLSFMHINSRGCPHWIATLGYSGCFSTSSAANDFGIQGDQQCGSALEPLGTSKTGHGKTHRAQLRSDSSLWLGQVRRLRYGGWDPLSSWRCTFCKSL